MFGSHSENGAQAWRGIIVRRPTRRKVSLQAVVALSIVLLLAGCAGTEQETAQAAKMSLSEARLIVKNRSWTDFLPGGIVIGDNPVSLVSCRYEELNPTVIGSNGKSIVDFGSRCRYRLGFPAGENANAHQFAAALLRWKMSPPAERQTWEAVQQQQFALSAENYRVSNPKPTIPEEVRRLRVLAEAAVNEKRYADAVRAYELGVEYAPWWSDGHFNAALVLGEIHRYAAAIDHMRKYLILNPNAVDARKIQDQIYAWGGGVSPVSASAPPLQLGVSFRMLSPEEAAALQKPDLKGVLVVTVRKGSVAEKAGITKGDVIVKYGDKPIVSDLDLPAAIIATKTGNAVPINVIRGSQKLILNAQY